MSKKKETIRKQKQNKQTKKSGKRWISATHSSKIIKVGVKSILLCLSISPKEEEDGKKEEKEIKELQV